MANAPGDRAMVWGRRLVLFSAAAFGLIGLGYLVAPGAMLAVVGVPAQPTTDFLMRTEGVALLTGAVLLWACGSGGRVQLSLGLLALAGYYVVGSLVDLAAFREGIVGPAALPSGVVRIGLGAGCALVALVLRRSADSHSI